MIEESLKVEWNRAIEQAARTAQKTFNGYGAYPDRANITEICNAIRALKIPTAGDIQEG